MITKGNFSAWLTPIVHVFVDDTNICTVYLYHTQLESMVLIYAQFRRVTLKSVDGCQADCDRQISELYPDFV